MRQAPRPQITVTAQRIHAAHARRLARALEGFLVRLRHPRGALSLTLVGDVAMRRLNREARGIDRTTDVLSFPQAPVPGSPLLGDLVISVAVARRRSRVLRRPLAQELELYAAHGLLHLLGHDHHSPSELLRMAHAERRLLGETGLVDRSREP